MESTICCINVLFLILWKHRVSLSSVSNPCPDIQPSTQVTDMCQTGLAVEQIGEFKEGNENFDHVTLQARTQEDNCTCLVFIENQISITSQMYIQPYRELPSSAPKESECGMELYLDFYYMEIAQPGKTVDTIKCSSGQLARSFALNRNSVLRFTSKLIMGNFTRGYCIDIQRVHVTGENGTLKIVCDIPNRIPSMNLTTPQSTDHPTDHQASDASSSTLKGDSTVYIAVGGSAGVLLILALVLVIIFYRRKVSDKNIKKPETSKPETTSTNEHDNPDYNGLKYNMLYVSADHKDVPEGDYHTVDNNKKSTHKKVSNDDINYSTIDDVACTSFKTVASHENTQKVLEYENYEGKEIAKREQNISPEGNGNTYAVVDKRRVAENFNNKKSAALSPVYAVVDKTGKLKMENKPS